MSNKEKLSIEELMKPRYEVIADYPGHLWPIGVIIIRDNRNVYCNAKYPLKLESYPEKYPAVFKSLQWWQKRKPKQMPDYVKDEEAVYKIHKWDDIVPDFWTAYTDYKGFYDYPLLASAVEPATEQEYLTYTQSIKK